MVTRLIDGTAIDAAKKGSADLLILALVDEQALHGYEIARRIEERSAGTLRFTLASLYATLYRLEERGWIRGRWVERAGQRRRRYYRITGMGETVLAAQREEWGRFIIALTHVAGLKPA
jgi:transcriptional regulator